MNIRKHLPKRGTGRLLVLAAVFQYTSFAAGQEVKPFALDTVSGFLELGLRYRNEERVRSTAESSFDTEDWRFYERLRVNLGGYIMHPRFIEYSLGPDLEYVQRRTTSASEDSGASENLLVGGDFRMTLLKEHPYTLSLYANKSENDVDSLFSESLTISRTVKGASLGFRKGPLPFTVRYEHANTEGSGGAMDLDDSSDSVTVNSRYRIGRRSRGDIRYNFLSLQQSAFDREFKNQNLSISNTTFLDKAEKIRLLGNLRGRKQTGSFETSTFSARETLSWRHTDNFSTRYALGFEKLKTGQQTVDIQNARMSLNHQLYESLHSRFNLHYSETNASASDVTQYGGDITESYTKRIQDWGRLNLSVRAYADYIDTDPRSDIVDVVDESVQFSGVAPVPLSRPDVIQGTLRITGDQRVTVYDEGLDYTVTTVGRTTMITRSNLGRIPDNATVLASYSYKIGLTRELLSSGGGINGRLSWRDRLDLYVSYELRRQDSLSGPEPTSLEELDRWRVGLKGSWKGLTGGLEYERRDSTITPYDASTQWLSLAFSPFRDVRSSVGVSRRTQTYHETGDDIESLNFQAMLSAQAWTRARFQLEGEYRQQRWDGPTASNDLDAYGIRASYIHRFRKITTEAAVVYSDIEQQGQIENRTKIEFSIRRDFRAGR